MNSWSDGSVNPPGRTVYVIEGITHVHFRTRKQILGVFDSMVTACEVAEKLQSREDYNFDELFVQGVPFNSTRITYDLENSKNWVRVKK